jgi:monoterpene epsilon-lactone hydrolase
VSESDHDTGTHPQSNSPGGSSPGTGFELPRASPLYGDLTDLPPVLLHIGEDEILLDDARCYAELLAQSGLAAELHIWEGMVHVFPANLVLLQAAREALDIAGEFLRLKRL